MIAKQSSNLIDNIDFAQHNMLDKDSILKIKLLLKKNLVEVIHVSSYIATIINAH